MKYRLNEQEMEKYLSIVSVRLVPLSVNPHSLSSEILALYQNPIYCMGYCPAASPCASPDSSIAAGAEAVAAFFYKKYSD